MSPRLPRSFRKTSTVTPAVLTDNGRLGAAIDGLLLDNTTHVKVSKKILTAQTRLQELANEDAFASYLDLEALGLVTTVMVTITLEKQSENHLAAFEAAVARCPDVISCHLMSGTDDYHLQVVARDIADFERIHKQHLSRMPGVARIHSSFAMREVVRRAIPETALRR